MNPLEHASIENRITFQLYEVWSELLGEGDVPSLKDLNPDVIADYRANTLLIDLRDPDEEPILSYVGDNLTSDINENMVGKYISEIPRRTILSRITDHYLEAIANRSPIAFDAEFMNRKKKKALYRGILLPFSDDGTNINFILGGIRWLFEESLPELEILDLDEEEIADDAALTNDQISKEPEESSVSEPEFDEDILELLEESPSLEDEPTDESSEILEPSPEITAEEEEPVEIETEHHVPSPAERELSEQEPPVEIESPFDVSLTSDNTPEELEILPVTKPSSVTEDNIEEKEDFAEEKDSLSTAPQDKALSEKEIQPVIGQEEPAQKITLASNDLQKLLAACRKSVKASGSRSRKSLYQSLGQILDFYRACIATPDDYQILLSKAKLKSQKRAPFTPILKMVFGLQFDKTRLTEYAKALKIAHENDIAGDHFASFILGFPGGIKGCVKTAREKNNPHTLEKRLLQDEVLENLPTLGEINLHFRTNLTLKDDYQIVITRKKGDNLEVIKFINDKKSLLEKLLKETVTTELKKNKEP